MPRADSAIVIEIQTDGRRQRLGSRCSLNGRSLDLRGASRSLDSIRMASKSTKKPPTTSSDGHESRRWREGASTRRDAEIALDDVVVEVKLTYEIHRLARPHMNTRWEQYGLAVVRRVADGTLIYHNNGSVAVLDVAS